MVEGKGKLIAFDLKTRVGQPSDATKTRRISGNSKRAILRNGLICWERLGGDLEPDFYDGSRNE
jgi:hypothetical protein